MKYKELSLMLCLSFCGSVLAENLETPCEASAEVVLEDTAKKSQVDQNNDQNDDNENQEIIVAEKFNNLIREEHERVRKVISDFVQENSEVLKQHVGKVINFKFEIGLEENSSSNKSLENNQDEPCSDCTSCSDAELAECEQTNC